MDEGKSALASERAVAASSGARGRENRQKGTTLIMPQAESKQQGEERLPRVDARAMPSLVWKSSFGYAVDSEETRGTLRQIVGVGFPVLLPRHFWHRIREAR